MMKILSVLSVISLMSLACKEDTPTQSGEATCPSTVSYGGKTYHAVQIGSQCWMKENLDIGAMIDSGQDAADNGIIEKYCYRNDPVHCNAYGGLYQWDEAMQYNVAPGTQGICPPGWHVPSLVEQDTLREAVGGDGNALKAVGQGAGRGAGTNTSGFSALMAGLREPDGYGSFHNIDAAAYFWSSTVDYVPYVFSLHLYSGSGSVGLDFSYPTLTGFSVRCLKNGSD